MKTFDCKVRLSGSLYNEVPKFDVTAPEIYILRVMHGDDAVVEVVETGKNKVSQSEERERLMDIYGGGLVANQKGKTPGEALSAVFGIAGRLPDEIPGATKKAKTADKPKEEPVEEDPPGDDDPEE